MLRFSLCWTHGPPKHRLCSEFDTALDLQKIREGKEVWGDGMHWVPIAVIMYLSIPGSTQNIENVGVARGRGYA
jgi:hypothetical protein